MSLSASKLINYAQIISNDSQNKEPVHDTATKDCTHMPTLFPQRPKLSKMALVALEGTRTNQDLVKFLHACYFFPFISTYIATIANGNYASFPRLTTDLVKKNTCQFMFLQSKDTCTKDDKAQDLPLLEQQPCY